MAYGHDRAWGWGERGSLATCSITAGSGQATITGSARKTLAVSCTMAMHRRMHLLRLGERGLRFGSRWAGWGKDDSRVEISARARVRAKP